MFFHTQLQIPNWVNRLPDWLKRLLQQIANAILNSLPVASFTLTPTEGEVPVVVTFDGSASRSRSPHGSITQYAWDFGDGQKGMGITITHTYDTARTYIIALTVTDTNGWADTCSHTFTALQPTVHPSFTLTPTTGEFPVMVTFDASASRPSDPHGSITSAAWDFGDGQKGSGITTTHTYVTAGTFSVTLTLMDNTGKTGVLSQSFTALPQTVPPDPSTVAPPIDRTIASTHAATTSFLYTGSQLTQKEMLPGVIDPQRATVLHGKVIDHTGAPLVGVTVTVLHHLEFGHALTRADGMFDLATNGGGMLTVSYTKDGYLPAQRQVQAPWQDYVGLEDLVLLSQDSKVTAVDLSVNSPHLAQGSLVTEPDGTLPRQATLFFSQGTQAEFMLADGSTQVVNDQLHVRTTEYSIGEKGPQAMPAKLPPSIGYTYAVEISADEALASGVETTRFNPPLMHYVENFLHFPVGTPVPVGYYDKVKATWMPADNGCVIQVLSITNGLADLDTNGDGVADNGVTGITTLGITDAERQQLASLYQAGQQLWRVPISHFSAWDFNWPFGPPPDAQPPALPPPDPGHIDDSCEEEGSSILIQNQVLSDEVAITGTSYTLRYQSDCSPGYKAAYALNISLSGGSLPASLKRIDLEIYIAGQCHALSFPPTTNQSYTFLWDGKDTYGRILQGEQPVTIRVGYVYPGVYNVEKPGGDYDQLFGHYSYYGAQATGNVTRQEVTLWQEMHAALGNWDNSALGLGGWRLNIHHSYHPGMKTLYLGDGKKPGISTRQQVITHVAGSTNYTGGYNGNGIPATGAWLNLPRGIALGPDGSLYIADHDNYCVRRIMPDGTILLFAGYSTPGHAPIAGNSGDGNQANSPYVQLGTPSSVAIGPDGSLYIADDSYHVIRRVAPDGIISTVAGGGSSIEEGIPAKQALLNFPQGLAVGPDGSLYIADSGHNRVRRVGPDGIISTVAGTGYPVSLDPTVPIGDGGQATEAALAQPDAVAIGPDGSLCIADSLHNRIRKVGPDGKITTLAGTGGKSESGDGGPAAAAQLNDPKGVAIGSDGTLYIADTYNHNLRRVGRMEFPMRKVPRSTASIAQGSI
jgi:PKD repeat protein/streptogramin lyase